MSGLPHIALAPMRDVVAALWKKGSRVEKYEDRPGVLIEAVVQEADRRNQADNIPGLDAWLLIYDEFASWCVSLASITAYKMRTYPTKPVPAPLKAYCLISGALCTHLFAVRKLVLSGFDVPAKQVLRSFVEHLDVLNLLVLRPELAEEFQRAETPEASNEFWNRYVRRGKVRKDLYGEIASALGDDQSAIEEWRSWRREEDTILSMAAHPTSIGCFMSICVPGADESEAWLGLFGAKGDVSTRTLRYAIYALTDLLVMHYFPFGEQGHFDRPAVIEFDPNDEFHRHVKDGRKVLFGLLHYVSSYANTHPELSAERSIDHWFADHEGE